MSQFNKIREGNGGFGLISWGFVLSKPLIISQFNEFIKKFKVSDWLSEVSLYQTPKLPLNSINLRKKFEFRLVFRIVVYSSLSSWEFKSYSDIFSLILLLNFIIYLKFCLSKRKDRNRGFVSCLHVSWISFTFFISLFCQVFIIMLIKLLILITKK